MTELEIKINGIEQMITELNEKYPFPNTWSAEIIRKYLEELKEKSIDNAE
jgi:hypothetical protein